MPVLPAEPRQRPAALAYHELGHRPVALAGGEQGEKPLRAEARQQHSVGLEHARELAQDVLELRDHEARLDEEGGAEGARRLRAQVVEQVGLDELHVRHTGIGGVPAGALDRLSQEVHADHAQAPSRNRHAEPAGAAASVQYVARLG